MVKKAFRTFLLVINKSFRTTSLCGGKLAWYLFETSRCWPHFTISCFPGRHWWIYVNLPFCCPERFLLAWKILFRWNFQRGIRHKNLSVNWLDVTSHYEVLYTLFVMKKGVRTLHVHIDIIHSFNII